MKRTHDASLPTTGGPSSKVVKATTGLAPIFAPKHTWVTQSDTMWHLRYGRPEGSPKIACFDLDGTLIRKSEESPWWHASVPAALRALVEAGTAVYIVTNQGFAPESKALKNWQGQIQRVLGRLNTPCHVFAAVGDAARDSANRKPMTGLFHHIRLANVTDIDLEQSFFVGDAAGRKRDHADTDRKWAENVGMPFYTPEQYFLHQAEENYVLRGFDAKAALAQALPLFTPTNTPLLPVDRQRAELVLLVGLPVSGQTSFARKYLESQGYHRIEEDGSKGIRLLDDILAKGGKAVVDTRLTTARARKLFVDKASERSVPVRCFRMNTLAIQCWHNNLFRAFSNSAPDRRRLLPASAWEECEATLVEPVLEEGFTEIKRINWTLWDASQEALREYASHYQINRSATRRIEGTKP